MDATSYGAAFQVVLSRGADRLAHSTLICKAGQLDVGGLGSSAAAGTGIVTIRITDVSGSSCALDGWPTLTFLGRSRRALTVTVSHKGPGTFFQSPRTVVLRPRTAPTAGFVVTSSDFPARNESCQSVASVRVVLPKVSAVFSGPALTNFADYHLCNSGDPVNISSITSAGVIDRYAPTYPPCLTDQLRLSLGRAGAASGSWGESGFLTNNSTAHCTLEGYPNLSLLNAAGRTVLKFGPGTATYTLFDPARPRPVTLEPGVAAKFDFSANDFNPIANAPCPPSDELQLVLPSNGGTIEFHQALRVCGLAGVGAFAEAA
jgi:hypothetical protein